MRILNFFKTANHLSKNTTTNAPIVKIKKLLAIFNSKNEKSDEEIYLHYKLLSMYQTYVTDSTIIEQTEELKLQVINKLEKQYDEKRKELKSQGKDCSDDHYFGLSTNLSLKDVCYNMTSQLEKAYKQPAKNQDSVLKMQESSFLYYKYEVENCHTKNPVYKRYSILYNDAKKTFLINNYIMDNSDIKTVPIDPGLRKPNYSIVDVIKYKAAKEIAKEVEALKNKSSKNIKINWSVSDKAVEFDMQYDYFDHSFEGVVTAGDSK